MKPKTKPQAPPCPLTAERMNASPSQSKSDDAQRQRCREAAESELPSVLDLAKVAATLGQGRTVDRTEADSLAEQAIELIEACTRARPFWVEDRTARALKKAVRKEEAARVSVRIPEPGQFPISLEDFLRFTTRAKRTDREARLRHYLKENILGNYGVARDGDGRFPQEADQRALIEAGELLERFKADGIAWHEYHEFAKQFIQWQDQQHSINAGLAANVRWKNRKPH